MFCVLQAMCDLKVHQKYRHDERLECKCRWNQIIKSFTFYFEGNKEHSND